jgi:hypothetical protein
LGAPLSGEFHSDSQVLRGNGHDLVVTPKPREKKLQILTDSVNALPQAWVFDWDSSSSTVTLSGATLSALTGDHLTLTRSQENWAVDAKSLGVVLNLRAEALERSVRRVAVDMTRVLFAALARNPFTPEDAVHACNAGLGILIVDYHLDDLLNAD